MMLRRSYDKKHRAANVRPGLEYEPFLFASLGADRNGMPLAVASMLGRLNLDPWDEAACMAALPADAAVGKLASLIEALPGQTLKHPECEALAASLIALLPRQPETATATAKVDPIAGTGASKGLGLGLYVVRLVIICVVLLAAGFADASWLKN